MTGWGLPVISPGPYNRRLRGLGGGKAKAEPWQAWNKTKVGVFKFLFHMLLVLFVFWTEMLWLPWTAIVAESLMSSSLRNKPSCMESPALTPSVLQVTRNKQKRRILQLTLKEEGGLMVKWSARLLLFGDKDSSIREFWREWASNIWSSGCLSLGNDHTRKLSSAILTSLLLFQDETIVLWTTEAALISV